MYFSSYCQKIRLIWGRIVRKELGPEWKFFQNDFESRCILTMSVKFVTYLVQFLLRIDTFTQTDLYKSDKASKYNGEFVDPYFKGLKITLLCLDWGRVFLLVVAWKRKKACRWFFYYESLIQMMGFFLPQKIYADADTAAMFWMQTTLLNFVLLYCDFKCSLATSWLSYVCLQASLSLVYDVEADTEQVTQMVLKSFLLLLWLAVSLSILHLLMLQVGN